MCTEPETVVQNELMYLNTRKEMKANSGTLGWAYLAIMD